MRATRLISLMLLAAMPTVACINTVGTKYDGDRGERVFDGGWLRLRNSQRIILQAKGATMERTLRDSKDFQDRSDYAVALMYLGRSAEAVTLLTELEREQPGQYYVAANLGTAYELSGNDTEALRWINEGIRRNPEDHNGTEWLHVKILQTKLAAARQPDYFEHHSVLDLEPKTIGKTISVGENSMAPKKIVEGLQYQLEERMKFVKPKDAVVAGLLYDYAVLEAITRSMESAKRILKMAEEYGFPTAKIDALQKDFDRRLAWRSFKKYSLIGVAVAGVIAALVFAYKRGWMVYVRSSQDLKNT